MGLEKIASQYLNFYAPTIQIEINNKKLKIDISRSIIDVSVDEKMDQLAGFSMTINDGFDFKTKTFEFLDDPLFKEGNVVKIQMGYSGKLFSMLVGKITAIESSFFTGETPTLTVRGEDLSVDYLSGASKERTFVGMKCSDIVKTIASDIGLNAVVDDAGKYREVFRKNNDESYLTFLKKIKKVTGYELKIEGKTLYFTEPGAAKKELLNLELRKDIISFNPTFKVTGLVTEVEVRGHNSKDPTKPFIGIAKAGSEQKQEPGKKPASKLAKDISKGSKRVISNVIVSSNEEAKERAQAELNKSSDRMITGDGECIGLPILRKGVNIKLEGMGDRFSGKYYVKGATHTFNNSGYRTRFSVKRNAL